MIFPVSAQWLRPDLEYVVFLYGDRVIFPSLTFPVFHCRLDPYTDPYYDYEIERFWRGGQYENFRVQYTDPDPYRNYRVSKVITPFRAFPFDFSSRCFLFLHVSGAAIEMGLFVYFHDASSYK